MPPSEHQDARRGDRCTGCEGRRGFAARPEIYPRIAVDEGKQTTILSAFQGHHDFPQNSQLEPLKPWHAGMRGATYSRGSVLNSGEENGR